VWEFKNKDKFNIKPCYNCSFRQCQQRMSLKIWVCWSIVSCWPFNFWKTWILSNSAVRTWELTDKVCLKAVWRAEQHSSERVARRKWWDEWLLNVMNIIGWIGMRHSKEHDHLLKCEGAIWDYAVVLTSLWLSAVWGFSPFKNWLLNSNSWRVLTDI
jgi:hypothetical protein